MKRIRQEKRTLAEFHCEVSKALNLALTKVEMDSSGNPSPMKEYANKEAVRTFILGLNSKYTSGTLYSHNPNDLETAYAIASTIYHDNVNSQFDIPQYNQHRQYNSTLQYQNQGRKYYEIPQRYRPKVQVQYNHTAPRQQHEPMNVAPSQQYTRSANRNHSAPQQNSYDRQMQGLAPNNPFRGDPQKRDRNPSSRNYNTQQKVQRVNQIREEKL
ncbi:uncharacterized protein LOC129240942 [Anastrepha obliqua]|nr:uncharacterized protein LOC129240645 [Anastrepha obliqua]XP_054732547.1 uncharacterized protein LOC129240646 [Anastrepha obliqua]XP_054732995.1 uncharacterized protein LOC129240942 [Anastrepha obliqua]